MMEQRKTGVVICRLLPLVIFFVICHGKIKSFTVSKRSGMSNECIEETDHVALVCDTEDTSSHIEIKRLQDRTTLKVSRPGERSLSYDINSTSCSDMGTYECVQDGTESKRADLVVGHCPLKLCDGAEVQRTIFVNVGESFNFSFCVLQCEEIAHHVEFNGSLVRKKNPTSSWTWDYEPVKSPGVTNMFNVSVKFVPETLGLLSVRIFSGGSLNYFVDISITLKSPGPPDCPTKITATSYGHDYVTLSWIPGLDGGSRQTFTVYHSEDNDTWPDLGRDTDKTTANVTGLSSNTSYYFRVVSMNRYRESVNADICEKTVFVITKSLFKPDEVLNEHEGSDMWTMSLLVFSPLAIILLLGAFLLWRRRVKERIARETNTRKDEATRETSLNDTVSSLGDRVSDDTLKYITVYPLRDQKRKRKKKQVKQQKVQYATLDFVQTEKLPRKNGPK